MELYSDHFLPHVMAQLNYSIRKVDIPAFDWPMAEPPAYKYPLEDNAEFNKQTE